MTRVHFRAILIFTASWLAAVPSALPAAEKPAAAGKPNIVFILADDLGLDGVGCCGSDVYEKQTPNIDSLAATGTRFETCFAAPLCGPSRCVLMTGRYAFRTGGLRNVSWDAGGVGAKAKDEYPIARLMKENGYATCQVGKWRQVGETPKDWGFEESCTDPTGGGWFWEKSYIKNDRTVTTDKEVYCPDVVQAFALDFIGRHKESPFFLYYAPHFVHVPIVRTPDSKPNAKDQKQLYADNLAYMDKQVGLVVKELERLGLREKTLVLFSSDNGTARKFPTTVNGRALSGHKGDMLEGGSRVPLIANRPGVTPAGKVLKDLVDFSDMYATFAELGGAAIPKGLPFDGRSFAPQLRGEPGHPREWVFVQLGAEWYVRSPAWKLTQAGKLFDMTDAPFVEKPVAADTTDAAAHDARKQLRTVLATLEPEAGKKERAGGRRRVDE